MSDVVRVAKADLFLWEEPCISAGKGSGAVFFSGCNLKCCFCQNYQISNQNFGKDISTSKLAKIFEELEARGACNINLVSPSHFVKQIVEALKIYRPKIPIVYNTNGYELIETLDMIRDYVDIFLTDLKFFAPELSQKYCKAQDYFEVASKAVRYMINLKPEVAIENGIMKSGVVVRHLVMPSCTEDSFEILNWLAQNAKGKCLVSLMSQYTPYFKSSNFEEINRKLKPIEYKIVLKKLVELGLTDGYAQELESGTEKYIPVWDLKGT